MKISIEKRSTSDGRQSLRLVFFFGYRFDPEKDAKVKQRAYESLDLFIYKSPKTPQERQHNKDVLQIAESVRAKRLLEMQSNKFGIPQRTKLTQDFLSYYKRIAESKRSGSKSNYSVWVSAGLHFERYVKHPVFSFEQITPQLLEGFKSYLKDMPITKSSGKLSSNTASTYFNKIRAALNQAYKDGIVRDNPVEQVKSIQLIQNKREYLTLDELKAIVKVECRYPVLKQAFLFSCMTGLRWSDINKLVWGEVHKFNDNHRIIFSQQKTSKLQYLDISDRAYELMGPREADGERVFKGLKYSDYFNTALLQWMIRAGIGKHITFHSGRHTFAVLQLTNGVDIYTVSKLLGHSELKTTQIYADIIEQKRKEAMLKVPDIFAD